MDSCRTISFVIPRVANQMITAVFNDNHSKPTPYSFADFPVTNIGECHFDNNVDSFIFDYNPILPNIGNDTAICAGQTILLDASGGEIVSWNWQNDASGTDTTFLVTGPGTYSVATTDICNIVSQESILVTQQNSAPLQLPDNAAVCQGEDINFTQPGFDHYTWSSTQPLSCTDCPTVAVSPSQSAWVYLHAMMNTGCQAFDSLYLTVNDTTYQLIDTSVCKGQTLAYQGENLAPGETELFQLTSVVGCDSTIVITVAGRDTFFTTEAQTICFGTSADIFGMPIGVSGNYAKVFVAANGCDSTHHIALTVTPPIVIELGADTEICEGETLTSTQSSATTYAWSPSGAVDCATCPSVTIAPAQTTMLHLQALNAEGCSVQDSVLITVHDTVYQVIDTIICNGSQVLWDGVTLLPGEQQVFNYQTSRGCDSTLLVRVIGTAIGTYQMQVDTSLCKGNSLIYNGLTLIAGQTEVFNLATLQTGCDSIVTLTIAPKDTFFTTATLRICGGETTDIFGTNIGVSGYYSKIFVAANGCDSTHNIALTVDQPIDIQLIAESTCPGISDGSIQSEVMGGQPPYNYQWSGGLVGTTLTQLAQGNYMLTITDEAGCTQTKTTTVNNYPAMQYDYTTDSVRCYNQSNGAIEMLFANDTTLLFSFDGKAFSTQRVFPQLAAGTYPVQIQDINGCIEQIDIQVWQPDQLQVLLPADTTIQLGDSIRLATQTNSLDPNLRYTWYPSQYLSCDTCSAPWAWPLKSLQYTLKVEDLHGCQAQDIMQLLVQRNINIFVPNVFAPEQQSENALLFPFTGTAVKKVLHFRVFDRWGELVHASEQKLPNDYALAWDGTLKNRLQPPGVYVWSLEVELADGSIEMYRGDVTLVR